MRFFRLHGIAFFFAIAFALGFVVTTQQQFAYCQETTGGLQGTVKDPSGAVVPKATVVLTGTTMIGSKELVTDSSGYYRFANLPPGTYTIIVKAEGFASYKREGLAIDIGRLPTVDIVLHVGAAATTVEVTGAAPMIDTTTTQNITNVNAAALQNLPTGTTFQSVIQFAPMARNEPLAGMSEHGSGQGGTGGSLPGSSGNGQSFGYSIGGAADSESSYLVEGQDTENISGGYSKANVPMDFIEEVDMKTSGVEAEYGGALGGVVNVIMKKGGNEFHGSLFSTYESSGMDANPINAYLRYDPTDSGTVDTSGDPIADPGVQLYQAQKDHFRTTQPGVTVGGPIYKDRVWFFAGFNPLYNSLARYVNFGSNDGNAGLQYFTQDRQTYFGNARIDAALSKKIRVFGSWLYQYARETGDNLPVGDPIDTESTYLNPSIGSPLSAFSHGLGWSAPNSTYNVGADITINQHLVSTTRYGYFFENYHDFGWPTGAPDLTWRYDSDGVVDNTSTPLPQNLQSYNGAPATAGTSTTPYLQSYTLFNSDKHYQLNQDFAVFHGGWWGTHNFKFGYQLNHLVNVISQNGNVPDVLMYAGKGHSYSPATETGADNCALLKTNAWGSCAGQYGYIRVIDFATVLPSPASDWNHAFYAQDQWNVGKGLTFDIGLRFEKESLPAPKGYDVKAINFSWGDKIAPRLGVAWDPTQKGKMKIFGSYGVVNDVMKLLLAQTSFGAQAYEECIYPLGPDGGPNGFMTSDLDVVFKDGRACPSGSSTTGANFASGSVPTSLTDAVSGVQLVENINLRPWEPVAPGVKPYRQHEYVAGWDYQITPRLAFEARYDRRRLDHVIEDGSLADVNNFELYTIINPGEGVNSTFDGYAKYLAQIGDVYGEPNTYFDYTSFMANGPCSSCQMPKAIRNYDGVELRLTMAPLHGITGMFSYTYSSLWGNYTGLTTTDQSDGGTTGRNSPDTTRAFDEPFYYYGANGKSNNGALPTDRPNVYKGYLYYSVNYWKRQTTSFGIFQQVLQGTPLGSYINLAYGYDSPIEATYVFGRDKWVNMSSDATGTVTIGQPYTKRTPWYTQTDLNAKHEIKVGEGKTISFDATALNALNQRAVVAYNQSMDSWFFETALYPGPYDFSSGAALYQELQGGYNVQQYLTSNGDGAPKVIKNSQYGQPLLFQNGRSFRLGLRYTF